jgi:hypothetical protein
MADVTVRQKSFIEEVGFTGTKPQFIQWVYEHVQYLPEATQQATKDFLTAEKFDGEYFRANEGRAALAALYRKEQLDAGFLDALEKEADVYHTSGLKLNSKQQLTRAFYLAEYVAYHTNENLVGKCIKAATYGIDAKCWQDAYYVALYPSQKRIGINSKELQVLIKIAEREMAHERDYGKLGVD